MDGVGSVDTQIYEMYLDKDKRQLLENRLDTDKD